MGPFKSHPHLSDIYHPGVTVPNSNNKRPWRGTAVCNLRGSCLGGTPILWRLTVFPAAGVIWSSKHDTPWMNTNAESPPLRHWPSCLKFYTLLQTSACTPTPLLDFPHRERASHHLVYSRIYLFRLFTVLPPPLRVYESSKSCPFRSLLHLQCLEEKRVYSKCSIKTQE